VLLARLRKLLGEERVGSAELKDDHRPNAFRMVPFAPPPPKKSEQSPLAVATALRVCRPPQNISVVFTGKVPARVFWDRQRYIVRETAGP
jgi:protein ImuB